MARHILAVQDAEAGRTYFRSPENEWSTSIYETNIVCDELRALGAVVIMTATEAGVAIDGN